jgi:hypothetical protein
MRAPGVREDQNDLPRQGEPEDRRVSPAASPTLLRLAGRAAQVIREHGALRDAELLAILACEPDELRVIIPILYRQRKVDRIGDYLVATPRPGEGGRAA